MSDPAALAAVLDARFGERYALPEGAPEKLARLAQVLIEDPRAPTAVREPAKVVDEHLADSLVALELDAVRAAGAVADIGSGAGLPGLPLAVALPGASFVLLESAGRKCGFIRHAAQVCGIPNAVAVHTRAEEWPAGLGRFDVVTARAVAALGVVAEYAAPLLKLGGVAVVWRGRRDPDEEAATAAACRELGLEPSEIVQVRPFAGAKHRYLHLMSKVMETPSGFPRRPGMAAKRPLGRRR